MGCAHQIYLNSTLEGEHSPPYTWRLRDRGGALMKLHWNVECRLTNGGIASLCLFNK
ncbi:hypothetical protein D1AOALGA4SA_6520 [Olavius algarvensis Delta 1 endosymbiont]|nr:hypothetical protein D1AOALGA4SA_6520 [Olavius algarvensis Delta 1 endosymbiont]